MSDLVRRLREQQEWENCPCRKCTLMREAADALTVLRATQPIDLNLGREERIAELKRELDDVREERDLLDSQQVWQSAAITDLTRERDEARALLDRACVWTGDEEGVWDTGCGHTFQFTEEGPVENHAAFCCYCGGKLLVRNAALLDANHASESCQSAESAESGVNRNETRP